MLAAGIWADRLYVPQARAVSQFADVQDGKCAEIVRLHTATDAVGALRSDRVPGPLTKAPAATPSRASEVVASTSDDPCFRSSCRLPHARFEGESSDDVR